MKPWISLLLSALAPAAFAQGLMTPSYQGLWWNSPAASESGWGLNITHQGNVLFATWFTYDADGSGLWLVLPQAELTSAAEPDPYGYGNVDTTIEYRGTLYRTSGPAWDAATFNSAAVTVNVVGSAVLRFTSADQGSFAFTVDGATRTKSITRQVFSTMPTCDFAAIAGAATNYQDLWWRSPAGSESGWGVNLAHQGDILFATWFTYDASGRPVWLVMPSGARTPAGAYTGALYRTRGPAFNASPWNPAQVAVTQVGSATFTFSDARNGMFAYTVDGVSRSKPITRQVFGDPVTVCR